MLDRLDEGVTVKVLLEFDAEGAFVQGWGGAGEGYDWPDTEHGIFVDHERHVWITGINPRAGGNVSDRSDDMVLKFIVDSNQLLGGKRDVISRPCDI